MSNETTLILSELAGNIGLSVSAADSAADISQRIIGKFEETKELELSEREQKAVLISREVQIDRLSDIGVPPVICNQIKQHTCGDALALSENEDNITFWLGVAENIQKSKVIALDEKTKAQVAKEQFESDPQAQWAERTKNIQPV